MTLGMLGDDARFWQAFYEWAVMSPYERAWRSLSDNVVLVQLTIADTFTPVVRRATWAAEDFVFEWRLTAQPRWKRPFLRLAHSLSKLRRVTA